MFGVSDGPEEDSPGRQEEQRSHGPATRVPSQLMLATKLLRYALIGHVSAG